MIKELIRRYYYIVYIGLSFYILDLYTRYINLDLNFGSMLSKSANLFTIAWILFLIFIIIFLRGRTRKIVYISLLVISNIMFLVNYFYYQVFGTFFSFKSIGLVEQGQGYFSIVFNYLNPALISTVIFSVLACYLACYTMPKDNIKRDKKLSLVFLVLAFTVYMGARLSLGAPAEKGVWDAWNYKRNIYNDFTDTRKSLQTAGYYEYMVRDMSISVNDKWLSQDTKEYRSQLDKYFDNKKVKDEQTEWSGMFKDKNIIIVLMESIDDWLVTEDVMPTVYNMMEESINFSNHFAPIYVSGATFNSEFMINTGYMTPLNEELAANKYGQNKFSESLPNLFKEKGYSANYFHMNVSSFYNRGQMSKSFGYDNYYSSKELGIELEEVVKDTHFMTNNNLKELILPKNKFMSFITTYSAHTPYTLDSIECSENITNDERTAIEEGADEEDICIRAQARQTDNLFKLLINNLEERNILEDTVIVVASDHYAYGLTDREKIYETKNLIDYNFIHQVPFFIWAKNVDPYKEKTVNSNLDFLPIVANLFGLDWDPKYYLGKDILGTDTDNFVFFSDYSWYDGNTYYKNQKVEFGDNVNNEYIEGINKELSELLKINKRVLQSDYFNK